MLAAFCSHVVGGGGVGDGGRGRVEAVLAAHAAAVAAEAVHVGEVGVLGAEPPGPGVEGILLVHVVVVSFSAGAGKARVSPGIYLTGSRARELTCRRSVSRPWGWHTA